MLDDHKDSALRARMARIPSGNWSVSSVTVALILLLLLLWLLLLVTVPYTHSTIMCNAEGFFGNICTPNLKKSN